MIASRAAILARGLGTRMRAENPRAALPPDQARAADEGFKALMPFGGRPFLDYILSVVADAGVQQVALVVPPAHEPLRAHYEGAGRPSRLVVDFVVQAEPDGTADAVLAAERWTRGEPFLALNGDNLYPVEAVRALTSLGDPGLAAFPRDALVRSGNFAPERIRAFATVDVTPDAWLAGIREKPTGERLSTGSAPALVSMNCWRFDSRIFDACRDIGRSSRGELELPAAVTLALERGVRFRVLTAFAGVLDLSARGDVAEVARRLAGTIPRP